MAHKLTKEEMAKGGRNSKRKPIDELWRDKLFAYDKKRDSSDLEDIYSTLKEAIADRNMKAVEIVLNRAFGNKQEIDLKADVGVQIVYAPKAAKDL